MPHPVTKRRPEIAKRGFVRTSLLAFALAMLALTPLMAHAAPMITGFTPHSGPIGTSVVVTGTDLSSVTSVQFGSVAVASFAVNAAGTTIETKVPVGATTNHIYILSPSGNAATGDNFTVTAALPTLTANNARTAAEGSATAPGFAEFGVTLSAPSTQTVTVHYQTTENTAKPASDYVAKSDTLTFAPGETSKTVKINFVGDAVAELNETFFLDLKTPTNATIVRSRASAYIRNDDGPSIAINNAVTVNEGNSGTTEQTFVVHLSSVSTETVTVKWATANNTANLDDYVAATGTLTFAPGETEKKIIVLVKGDTIMEPNETYWVNLFDATFAVIGDSQAVAYIRNDDTATIQSDEPSR